MSDWLLDAITAPRNGNGAEPREPDERILLGRAARDFIEHGAPLGEQRSEALKAARNLWSAGYELDDAAEAIWAGLQASPWDAAKGPWTFADAYQIAESIFTSEPTPLKPLEQGIPYVRSRNGHRAAGEPKTVPPAGQFKGSRHDGDGFDAQHLPPFARTDTGSAELFSHLFGNRVRFDHRRGVWLLWQRHWWRPDDTGAIYPLAIEAARRRYLAAMNISSENERTAEAKYAIVSENRQRIDAMLALARTLSPIADNGDGWDSDPWSLAVENGVLDLSTGTIRDGKSEDRISRHAPVVFDPDAVAPVFEGFIKKVLPNRAVRRYVQRHAGRALTGLSVQELGFWWGGGANGKTTFAKAIMHVMGPMLAVQAAPGLLLKARGERHPTEIANLYGARLVVSVEVDADRVMAEALLKWLTGGDALKGRFMRQDFFQFEPTFKLWLLANDRPTVRGQDEATWRRIKLTPWTVTIPAEERDEELGDKLRAEASGILNWMLEGLADWQRGGMQEPDAVSEAVRQYREESDATATFIEEKCVLDDPEARTGADGLYRAYKAWAENAGLSDRETLSSKRFGAAMQRRFERKTVEGRRWYYGVQLRAGGAT